VKKQPKKARKTIIFEPKKCGNGDSVAKLYFNSNGGMRVGGGGFSKGIFYVQFTFSYSIFFALFICSY